LGGHRPYSQEKQGALFTLSTPKLAGRAVVNVLKDSYLQSLLGCAAVSEAAEFQHVCRAGGHTRGNASPVFRAYLP